MFYLLFFHKLSFQAFSLCFQSVSVPKRCLKVTYDLNELLWLLGLLLS